MASKPFHHYSLLGSTTKSLLFPNQGPRKPKRHPSHLSAAVPIEPAAPLPLLKLPRDLSTASRATLACLLPRWSLLDHHHYRRQNLCHHYHRHPHHPLQPRWSLLGEGRISHGQSLPHNKVLQVQPSQSLMKAKKEFAKEIASLFLQDLSSQVWRSMSTPASASFSSFST